MPLNYIKVFVGCVVFKSVNCLCCVIVADVVLFDKVKDFFIEKSLILIINKEVFVAEEYLPHNSPVVVNEIRIEEIKAF